MKKAKLLIVAITCAFALLLIGCSGGSDQSSASKAGDSVTGVYDIETVDGKTLEEFNEANPTQAIESFTLELADSGAATLVGQARNGNSGSFDGSYTYEDGQLLVDFPGENGALEGTYSDGVLAVDIVDTSGKTSEPFALTFTKR